jgi:predicted phage terminase large subunit-like protein
MSNNSRRELELELIAQQKIEFASKARKHFGPFVPYTMPAYQSVWFNKELRIVLNDFAYGKIKKLMIFCPPQHGKSQLVSRSLPPFILGIDPTKQIAGVSYSGDFAKRFSRDAKRIIQSREYQELFPETRINTSRKRDQDEVATANMYEIVKHHGCHQTVGVGGLLTGVTVDIGIIDDIIKDSVEANSETTRQNHWDWYETVFTTRLHNNSQQLITFTRWHEDDLAGRLLDQEGDEWVVVNLPALFEDNDRAWEKDKRQIDECLWPERHSQKRMEDKRDKNPRTFAALYQQRPSPEDGLIIDVNDFEYYDPAEITKFSEMIQTWDCSFKGKVKSDWVVGQVWGRIGAKYYLVDQLRGKWGIKKTMENILNMTIKYPKAKVKLVEDAANGPAVIEILQEHITGMIPKTPDVDKESRAKAVAHCVESHNVYLPLITKCPWVKGFVEEWRSFPNGAHDDQVDASTQAWHRFETRPKIVNLNMGIITKKAIFRNQGVNS